MGIMTDKNSGEFKFFILLIALFASILIPPMFDGFTFFNLVWKLSLSIVLFSSLYAISSIKHVWPITFILLIPSLATVWIEFFSPMPALYMLDNLTTIAFLGFVSYQLFMYILKNAKVTTNVVYASMCLYLLIALMWAAIYANIDFFYDGAFAFAQADALQDRLANEHSMSLFTYYSFVTLTTLGYGDITPIHKVAEAWSTFEAMIGQFYIAIILARIVALHSTAKD